MTSRASPSRGTAINLFVQSLLRLSVDIDLAYLPLEPRDETLRRCREVLQRIAETFNARLVGVRWKLANIQRMGLEKHRQSLELLEQALGSLRR